MKHIALGMKRDDAIAIAKLTRHQYYYKPKQGKSGRKVSTHTLHISDKQESLVENSKVVEQMKDIQSNKDLCCGKTRMTAQLQMRGYHINEKKVYRLMKENHLLLDKPTKAKRKYVKYRIVSPKCPLSHLEMDIKFFWIESCKAHAYNLTVLDIFTRKVLEWHVGMSITQHTVKSVFERVIVNHLQAYDMLSKGIDIEIRNDNDRRFCAKLVQEFFEKNYLNQVFTHPYTPQENGHIESFHKILSTALSAEHFYTLDELKTRLTVFYDNYNNHRAHSAICGLTPHLFEQAWHNDSVERIEMDNHKVIFKLRRHRTKLSGNESLREASCSKSDALNGQKILNEKHNKEANGATALTTIGTKCRRRSHLAETNL